MCWFGIVNIIYNIVINLFAAFCIRPKGRRRNWKNDAIYMEPWPYWGGEFDIHGKLGPVKSKLIIVIRV